MVGDKVYVEPHRSGKVKKPYDVDKIGEKEKQDLILAAKYELSSVPEECRRKPGKKATLLGLDNQ